MFNRIAIATGIVIAAIGAISYLGIQHESQLSATASQLHDIASVTQLSQGTDGTYPATLSMESNPICAPDLATVFGDTCEELSSYPTGVTISYAANADGTHYVLAAQEDSGKVYVVSDTDPIGGECDTYAVGCLAGVTDDAQLISSIPSWTTF